MDSHLLEYFKQINNLIKNMHEPINIFQLSKKLNLSIPQSRLILNYFITQGNILNEYIVIFSAEILEANKIKSILVPSYSSKLNEILDNTNLLDFGVFAILKKEAEFMLKDYSLFCYENELVENLKINKNAKKENNTKIAAPSKNTNGTTTIGNNKHIQIKASNPINTIKKEQEITDSTHDNKNNNDSANKSDTSLSKAFNNKVNIKNVMNKKETNSKPVTENKDEVKIDLKASEHDSLIEDLIANYVEINTEDNKINKKTTEVVDDKNECYYENKSSILGGGKEKLNHQKNPKASGVIINYKPKQIQEDIPETNASNISKNVEVRNQTYDLPVPEKRKRVDSDNECTNKNPLQTKKKNNSENLMTKNITNISVREDRDSLNITDPHQEESSLKKIKKIRKVKKTNTYFDDKGYLHTKDEWEDEEYWSDEKKKPLPIQQPIVHNKNKKAGNKKIAHNQASLHSFFGK